MAARSGVATASTIPTRTDHERGLAAFVEPIRRPRFLAALDDPRLRRKLRQRLAHFAWLDPHHAEAIPTPDPATLATHLHAEGAPATCFVISGDDALDGHELPLEEALHRVLHDDDGALISCIPGRLALFSPEAPNPTTTILRHP